MFSDSDEKTFLLIAAYVLLKKRKRALKRRFIVRPKNRERPRPKQGFYVTQFIPMKREDSEEFFMYTRMDKELFNKLCTYLRSHFAMKRRLPDVTLIEEKLALTLHYLSQGTSMQAIASKYQMGHATVRKIILSTCDAIWKVLQPIYIKPHTSNDWKVIAEDFNTYLDFPNCLGAIDGKHINIAQAKEGTLKTLSVVLLAAVDIDYKFTLVDIGAYDSQSDGGIVRKSQFGQELDVNNMHMPKSTCLPHTDIQCSYAFVGDEAFPLKSYIFRPYPGPALQRYQSVFNYRLSRPRRIAENAFGILAARWRILQNVLDTNVDTVDKIVQATVALHNFLQTDGREFYSPDAFTDTSDADDGYWRTEIEPLKSVGRMASNNATLASYQHRDLMAEYFLSLEGEILSQYET